MQVNGIRNDHSSQHHVTNCIHSHGGDKKTGDAGMASAAQGNQSSSVNSEITREGHFSLSAWMKNTLNGGKKLLQNIWGSSAEETSSTLVNDKEIQALNQMTIQAAEESTQALNRSPAQNMGQQTSESGTPGNTVKLHGPQIAAAASGVQTPQNILQQNPYFSAVEDTGRQQENLWQKMKVRFQAITGYLTKQFSGRNSFQAKQEQPKEDLRRHSRYRQDNLEVECVLMDDSYLLDSYDKKGEYSKLSAKK